MPVIFGAVSSVCPDVHTEQLKFKKNNKIKQQHQTKTKTPNVA